MNCEKARCANCLVNEATHGSIFCQPCLDTMAFKRFIHDHNLDWGFSFTEGGDPGERSYIVKRYVKGRCVAIRWACGMTLELICASMSRDPVPAKQWKPFNETTGEFLP
jgi:hypothetical protein